MPPKRLAGSARPELGHRREDTGGCATGPRLRGAALPDRHPLRCGSGGSRGRPPFRHGEAITAGVPALPRLRPDDGHSRRPARRRRRSGGWRRTGLRAPPLGERGSCSPSGRRVPGAPLLRAMAAAPAGCPPVGRAGGTTGAGSGMGGRRRRGCSARRAAGSGGTARSRGAPRARLGGGRQCVRGSGASAPGRAGCRPSTERAEGVRGPGAGAAGCGPGARAASRGACEIASESALPARRRR